MDLRLVAIMFRQVLGTLHVLFFIDMHTRAVLIGGVSGDAATT